MKLPPYRPGLVGVLAFHLMGAGNGGAEGRPSCAEVARKIQSDVAARPERVLIIVEDALVVDESCACEVVKAAIVASKAGPKLVGHIVFTAVTATAKSAALIAECATAASPDAAAEIRSALTKALGENSSVVVSSPSPSPEAFAGQPSTSTSAAGEGEANKNPGSDKNLSPSPKQPPADSDAAPVAVGGVYLVYPGGGGTRLFKDAHGRVSLLGPDGRSIPLGPPPDRIRRPPRKPKVIIIRPPTATSSDELPAH
jgi:hypothetical protein